VGEGGDHFGSGFGKERADQLFQDTGTKGEIEEKIDPRAAVSSGVNCQRLVRCETVL